MVTEHTHIPVSARDGRRATAASCDEKYRRTHDPFVALAFAAAATERLVVGTSVCLVIEHDPIVLAKQIASLDRTSPAGASCSASARAGTSRRCATTAPTRRRATATCASASRRCKAIWADDEAEYHGKHVDFDPIWQWPKPRSPRRRCFIGGNGPRVEDRVLRYGDGWMPNMKEIETLGAADRGAARARRHATSRSPTTAPRRRTSTRCARRAWTAALIVLESGPSRGAGLDTLTLT